MTAEVDMKNVFRLAAMILPIAIIALFFVSSCEGPRGPAGADGQDGQDGVDGVDANETCKQCHNPLSVDKIQAEYEFSKHSWGEAAFEEAGNTTCTPCHADRAFRYVVENNVPATFTLNATTQKYSNNYVTVAGESLGLIDCATCHSSLHTAYTDTDFVFTNTAAVSMTMWKGAKSINLTQDGGVSNLCVKCHQPRPLTKASLTDKVTTDADSLRFNGDVLDYAGLASAPADTFWYNYDLSRNVIFPSYRTHVHYGVVGAVYAGTGGVEFAGTEAYNSSTHTTVASCPDCHMADVYQRGGGHTFFMRGTDVELGLTSSTTWNFNGCNVSGCHSAAPISATSTTKWSTPRANQKTKLNTLAAKLNALGGGTKILHVNTDPVTNLWYGMTTDNYDGYLDIYDPSTNATGAWRNPNPSSSWTTAQKNTNNALPDFPSLTKRDMGAMINFQFALREYSLGIHNTTYTNALLTNTIALYP